MQARLRLTLLYAGLFLVLGTGLLMLIYLLTRTTARVALATPNGVLVGPAIAQQNSDFNHLLAISWIVLAITTVVAALFGWFAAGRVLRPVRAIAGTARTISAGNLNQRLALSGPNDEFKQLGDTLDDLFARLEASFEAQRRFVANASHELRTPLTLERTLLELAIENPNRNAETLHSTCEELLACNRDQERLLESLLTLASSERGLDHRETVDLVQITERALEANQAALERRSLRTEVRLEPAVIDGDPVLVERLAANLINNAASYNIPGGRVEVRTASEDGHALLTVANTGAEIPLAAAERLFEPFARLDGDRAAPSNGHHGLGLSIVRAIARAHRGTVTAEPQPGGGLSVTVRFAESAHSTPSLRA